MQVDHFSYTNQETFKMRYMVADQYWDADTGPIFFYMGNENKIEVFINLTVRASAVSFYPCFIVCCSSVLPPSEAIFLYPKVRDRI